MRGNSIAVVTMQTKAVNSSVLHQSQRPSRIRSVSEWTKKEGIHCLITLLGLCFRTKVKEEGKTALALFAGTEIIRSWDKMGTGRFRSRTCYTNKMAFNGI